MTLKYLPCILGLEGRLKYWISLQKKYFLLIVFYWTNQPTIRTSYRQNKSKPQEKTLLLFFLLKINPRHMLLSWQVYFKSKTMLSLCLLSIKKKKANKVSDKREMLIRKFYLYISCLTCRVAKYFQTETDPDLAVLWCLNHKMNNNLFTKHP